MTLEQIIKGCQHGEVTQQEQLYKLIAPELYAVCLKYSKNQELAKDNLQDGFLLIFKKIYQFEFKGSFKGWAKRVMINQCLQEYKKMIPLETLNEAQSYEVEEVELNEDISIDFLLKIIQELPTRYRHVFNLYVLDGFSHSEISNLMGISEGTSKSNLARARKILKVKIENQQDTLKKKVN
ncbi:MAG: RNA polymerase sigma factor [Flavobacterium sp.]